MKTKFYEISQSNSGGSFITDDKLCHRLIIEAENVDDAIFKAESLGCYWNGVDDGMDCPCCGDRWYTPYGEIELDKWKKEGYTIGVYSHYDDAEGRWFERYGHYSVFESPKWTKNNVGTKEFRGSIYFKNIEQYAQYLADEYGWTTPDCRIFYLDGRVVEISKRDVSKKSKKRILSEKVK